MQKIVIKNFRQITYAEIEISKIVLFIGEQASGKSTIAKLIYFFKSLKQDYFNFVITNQNPSFEADFIKMIQDKFRVYFGSTSELAGNFEITYYYCDSTNRTIKLYKSRALLIDIAPNFWSDLYSVTGKLVNEINEYNNNEFLKKDFVVKGKRKAILFDNLNKKIGDVFCDHREPMFIPAGRNITVSYPEQFQLLFYSEIANPSAGSSKSVDMQLMKEFISYSKFLSDYYKSDPIRTAKPEHVATFLSQTISHIIHGKYKNIDGNEKIYFEGDKKSIPLNIASSGQQESIRIIQDIVYVALEKIAAFRIIEEPEAHLYPKAQKLLIEILIFIANYCDSQLIITTHSPYVLTTFNNLLYYTKLLNETPGKTAQVDEHFMTKDLVRTNNEKINIDFNDFQAYSLSVKRADYCQSILDVKTQLIGENFIDEETEKLNNDFDYMYSII